MMLTPNGDIILTGGIFGYGFNSLYLMKLDGAGNFIWMKYAEIDFGNYIRMLQATDTSFFVVSNYTTVHQSHLYLLQFDFDGNLITKKGFLIPFTYSSSVDNALQASDHSIYIISTEAITGFARLTRIDSGGNCLWSVVFSNTLNMPSLPQFVEGGDHNIYVTTGRYYNNQRNISIIKVHPEGSIAWAKQYGDTAYQDVLAYSCTTDANGNICTAGSIRYDEDYSNYDYLFVKFDTAGNVIQNKVYGMPYPMSGAVINPTNDSGFLMAGATGSWITNVPFSLYLVKTTDSANAGCDSSIYFHYLEPLPVDDSLEVLDSETVSFNITDTVPEITAGTMTIFTVCEDSSIATFVMPFYDEISLSVFPNPADDKVKVTVEGSDRAFDLTITNVMGAELLLIHVITQPAELNLLSLPSGFYEIKFSDGQRTLVRKLIVK